MEFLRRQVTLPTQALDRFRMNTKSVSSFYGSDIVFKGHRIPAFVYCCDATIKHRLWSVKRENDKGLALLLGVPCWNVRPNPPVDTDGRREDSGRGVRELQAR